MDISRWRRVVAQQHDACVGDESEDEDDGSFSSDSLASLDDYEELEVRIMF